MENEKINYSMEDLDYTTKTKGYVEVMVPYLKRQIERQEAVLRSAERKLRDNEQSDVKYELGVLEGMKRALNAPDYIRKGVRLKQGKVSY